MINSPRMMAAALLLAMSTAATALGQDQGQQQTPMMGPGAMMAPGMMGYGMGPGMMGPGMHGMMGQSMMGPGMMMGYGPMVEDRLAYLKAELGITDAQTEAWNGYVNAVKARAEVVQ